jgi:hypothetical protein
MKKVRRGIVTGNRDFWERSGEMMKMNLQGRSEFPPMRISGLWEAPIRGMAMTVSHDVLGIP